MSGNGHVHKLVVQRSELTREGRRRDKVNPLRARPEPGKSAVKCAEFIKILLIGEYKYKMRVS